MSRFCFQISPHDAALLQCTARIDQNPIPVTVLAEAAFMHFCN